MDLNTKDFMLSPRLKTMILALVFLFTLPYCASKGMGGGGGGMGPKKNQAINDPIGNSHGDNFGPLPQDDRNESFPEGSPDANMNDQDTTPYPEDGDPTLPPGDEAAGETAPPTPTIDGGTGETTQLDEEEQWGAPRRSVSNGLFIESEDAAPPQAILEQARVQAQNPFSESSPAPPLRERVRTQERGLSSHKQRTRMRSIRRQSRTRRR